ncbi:MAG: Virginiamycin A acetyltransferase [Candidatus Anoxychlamydiales bacterium]|nr:Virginiamycin A acetyltransferase [Candidatus Anoxychlamydiales bacterium]NGX36730.1 Virginiamycin A acetyltransferase [Candidatus Anoxychlamydiales bacterium]
MLGPDPNYPYPFEKLSYELENLKRTVFLKNVVTRDNIEVGDYTYFDDPKGADDFENKNVLYHYPFSKEKLIFGKFCMVATDVKFIMSGANHKIDGFSTYPFAIFGLGWEKEMDITKIASKGDTICENDIWFGYGSTIMPGIKIGSGAIIGAMAVVTKDVPAYSIVAGNPAKIIRQRFDDKTIEALLKIKWWDWDIKKITQNIKHIIRADLEKLKNAKKS